MLTSLMTNFMVRSRPDTRLKTFNVDYVRAISKQDAINRLDQTIEARGDTVIDVLKPGEQAYGMTKKDIQDLFRQK